MKQTDIPSNILSVFANSATTGYINSIQQTDPGNGHASFALGFPPVTFQDVAAGGQPPFGSDFNGILNLLSAHDQWVNSGAVYPYDSAFSTAIGGYPKGAKVGNSTGDGTWMSTVDDNTTDPSSDTSGKWVPFDNSSVTTVTLSGSNVTLTPAQYQNRIIILSGTLTSNIQITFPSIATIWKVVNSTSGSYTVTLKTASGSGVQIKQGVSGSIFCDQSIIRSEFNYRPFVVSSILELVQSTFSYDYVSTDSFYAGGSKGGCDFYKSNTGQTPTTATTAAIITALATGKVVNAAGVEYTMKTDKKLSIYEFGGIEGGVTDVSASAVSMYAFLGKVYLPAGSWLIDASYLTTTSASMHIYGDGIGKSTLIAPRTAGSSSQGVIYAESTSSTTFVSGVFIHDLTIYGESDTLGLSEFKHLVSLNGVDLFIIQRVEFKGFRGDAVYIGSGISGSAERHNKHGKILDCVFDGINYSNRNGVSIIDGYDVEVAGNTFLNCTDPTMPGPIDIEPDQVTVNVVKDIKIHHNTIVSFGGGSGIAFTTTAGVMTNKPSNIEICNNDIRGATKSNAIMIMARTVETISSSLSPMGVKINRNYTEDTNSVSVYPTNIYGIRGLEKIGNTHIGGSICVLGLDTTASVTLMDAIIRGNNYTKNGNSVGAVQFASIDNVEFSGNTIQEPKNGTGTYGVTLIGSGVTTTSTRFRAFDNTFIKGASQTHSFYATSHTQDPTTARNDNNQSSGGSLTNVLQANKMDTAAAPTTGTWATGNIVFSTTGANAGWRCSAGGTPGTWASF